VKVKYRCRIAGRKDEGKQRTKKINTQNLRIPEVAKEYEGEIKNKVAERRMDMDEGSIDDKWNIMQTIIKETARETLGYEKNEGKRDWFDDECREAIQQKNQAYKECTNRNTRQKRAEYERLRRIADKTCRKKKRQWLNKKYMDIEEEFKLGNQYKAYREIKI